MYQVSADEAQARLAELIEAALQGATVLIAKDDQHVVQLTPFTRPRHRRQAGSARGQIVMRADFDAPLDDFAEYMQ